MQVRCTSVQYTDNTDGKGEVTEAELRKAARDAGTDVHRITVS